MHSNPPPSEPLTFKSCFISIIEFVWFLLIIIPSVIYAILKNLFKREKNLKGKIVLVTGAGNGLGKEMALQLARQGCTILCVDMRSKDNQKTLEEISQRNGLGRAYRCDVSNMHEVKALSERILDEFGRVDILINNAGLIFGNGILSGTDEQVLKVVNVNFMSNVWMIRAFLPTMISNKEGHIVCIASASAIHALGHGNIYSCSKFAILGLAYSLLEELRTHNLLREIKISCALPYFISTKTTYTSQWRLRYPAMSTEEAAALIIKGFRKEFKFYTVPWVAFGYNITSSLKLLPMNVYNYMRRRYYADIVIKDCLIKE